MSQSLRAGDPTHIVARTEVALRAGTDANRRAPRNDRGIRVTVLIVDDHADFRAWAGAMLRADGYDVVGEAADGADAEAAAQALRPDVVLLDVQLPGGSGFGVARGLRDAGFEVVLISTRDRDDYGPAVDRCGARGFIGKVDLSGPALDAVLA
jgi:DNA-binding NarL/FixJ family response regulator